MVPDTNQHSTGGGDTVTQVKIDTAEDCAHDSIDWLGSDGGNNTYLKCLDCGGVIVGQGSMDVDLQREERTVQDRSIEDPSPEGANGMTIDSMFLGGFRLESRWHILRRLRGFVRTRMDERRRDE